MKRWLWLKDKKRFALLAALTLLGVSVIAFGALRNEPNVSRYYSQRLEKLYGVVSQLPEAPKTADNAEDQLKSYDEQLNEGLTICREMTEKRRVLAGRTLTEELQSSIDQVDKLCYDLSEVFKYSRSLYSSLGPYLTLDSGGWPPADTAAFSGRLWETKKVTKHTIALLEKISSPIVEDPALSELIGQVRVADTLAVQTEKALEQKDTAKAQASAERLLKETVQDRTDFLAARRYFWQSTIRIDQLRSSIQDLQGQFIP